MTERTIAAREILFREGEAADVAYVIRSGSVEVLKRGESGEVRIAEIGAGELVGEMSLFEPSHKHSATIRAITDVVVETVSAQELEADLQQCPPRILPVLMSIFRRLRITNQRIVEKEQATAVLGGEVDKVIIAANSDMLNEFLNQPMEVPVTHLPFRIGGYGKDEENGHSKKGNHLNIASSGPPLTVSANHCEIILQEESLYVLDLGSRFGTTVNDTSIGRGKGVYKAPLQKGENLLILGDRKTSPYKLKVVCL